MAGGHVIVGGCQVTALRHDRAGWSVYAADGLAEIPGNGGFSAVILPMPAPQALPLIASAVSLCRNSKGFAMRRAGP